MLGTTTARRDGRPRGRRAAVALLLLVAFVGTVLEPVVAGPAAASGPIGSPPGNGRVLSPGQIPTVCTQADFDAGASAYRSNSGYYWSDVSSRWLSAPYCYPRWGGMAASPSQIVRAGDTVTVTAIPDDGRMAGLVAVQGGMSWSAPGERISGCQTTDVTCTVRLGTAGAPPAEWAWSEFRISGPGRVFILPPSYAPRCQESNPCLDTYTNAWSWVGVRPAGPEPLEATVHHNDTFTPGQVQLVAETTGGTAPYSYDWTFGDDTPAEAGIATTVHTYAKPGTYTARVDVSDESGQETTATHEIEVKAPELSVSVTLPDKNQSELALEETTTARVTVRASDEGLGDLSGLHFVGDPLDISPADRISITTGPDPEVPAAPFTLAAGASRTFDFEVRGDAVGLTSLASRIDGVDAAGRTVTANGSTPVNVKVTYLVVTLTPDPADFKVAQDDDGPVPQDVVVTMKVKNIHDEPVEHVVVDGRLQIRSLDERVPDEFPIEQTDESTDDRPLGTIQPGTTKTETFHVQVTGDGNYRLSGLVTFDNPTSAGQLVELPSTDVKSGTTIAYFEAHITGGNDRVVIAGNDYQARGVVENRSSTKKLILKPLFADREANAGKGTVFREPGLAKCDCGLPMYLELEPGEKATWAATIGTVSGGGVQSRVSFAPEFALKNPDGSQTDLDPAKDVRIKDNLTEFRLHVDDSAPEVVPGDPVTWALNFSWNAIKGTFKAIAGAIEMVFIGIPSALGSEINHILAGERTVTSRLAMVYLNSMDYIATAWVESFDPGPNRRAFLDEVADSIDQEIFDQFGISGSQVGAFVDNAVQSGFQPFADAWASGDYDTATALAGDAVGQIVGPEIGPALLSKVVRRAATCLLAKLERQGIVTLGEKLVPAPPSPKSFPEGLEGIKAGAVITDDAAAGIYGVSRADMDGLRAWTKLRNYIVSFRYRQPISLKWVEELGAVLKPQNMKLKNVDATDVAFLGYREADVGSVVYKTPIGEAGFEAALLQRGVVPGSAEDVIARGRYKTRVKEWNEDFAKYSKYAKPVEDGGGLPVGFDYASNTIGGDLRATVFKKRPFELREVSPGYYEAYLADDAGVMRRITGDIDLVDIRHADGRALTMAERAQAYDDLQGLIGAQHGETPTWVNNDTGEYLWQTKAKLLDDHTLTGGGEAVAQVGPDGVTRATYIDPRFSWFDNATKESYIWWIGGYRTLNGDVDAVTQFAIKKLKDLKFQPYQAPKGWNVGGQTVKVTAPGQGQGQNKAQALPGPQARVSVSVQESEPECAVTFANTAGAVVAHPDDDGGLAQWRIGQGWGSSDVVQRCRAGEVVALFPQSSVTGDVPAGAARVEVNDLAAVTGLDGGVDWFAPGQEVVLNPGGENEEVATVAALGSLVFRDALVFEHQAGEMVAALGPPPAYVPPVVGTPGALPATGTAGVVALPQNPVTSLLCPAGRRPVLVRVRVRGRRGRSRIRSQRLVCKKGRKAKRSRKARRVRTRRR